MRRYAIGVAALDAVVVALTTLACAAVASPADVPAGVLVPAVVVLWAAALAVAGAYAPRRLTVGPDEYRGVTSAATRLTAAVGVVSLLGASLDGTVTLTLLAASAVAVATGRHAARTWLRRQRSQGAYMHRVLAVGSVDEVAALTRRLDNASHAGLRVVAACTPADDVELDVSGRIVPVLAGPDDALAAVAVAAADVVAVAGSGALGEGAVRRLAWELEGSGVDLVVAPGITDVAGPRIAVRPVAGLPLLHVDEPQLGGPGRLVAGVANRLAAAAGLLVLLPVLVAIALAVKLTSAGPVFFCQRRVGRGGREFCMWKFRTMRPGAEDELELLLDLNEADGPLFKVREDPRITPLGKWLRRYSLDELPQLWNVVRGDMAIVGPRPPLPAEVSQFEADVHRRFLVKPGLTGLWQVSGRADLPWEEAVRLDLYYVDNWSLAMDATIVWKTLGAVLRGPGAY